MIEPPDPSDYCQDDIHTPFDATGYADALESFAKTDAARKERTAVTPRQGLRR